MSTPSSSDSGNIIPASITMMSSPYRKAIEFIPNSPSPPIGMICSFRSAIREKLKSNMHMQPRRPLAYDDFHPPGAAVHARGACQSDHSEDPHRIGAAAEIFSAVSFPFELSHPLPVRAAHERSPEIG